MERGDCKPIRGLADVVNIHDLLTKELINTYFTRNALVRPQYNNTARCARQIIFQICCNLSCVLLPMNTPGLLNMCLYMYMYNTYNYVKHVPQSGIAGPFFRNTRHIHPLATSSENWSHRSESRARGHLTTTAKSVDACADLQEWRRNSERKERVWYARDLPYPVGLLINTSSPSSRHSGHSCRFMLS